MENLYPTIGNVTRIEYGGQPVVTTAQLTEFYETGTENIKRNFSNNSERFIEGKHYFKLEGDELDILRRKNFHLQISPMTRALYLWTKRGGEDNERIGFSQKQSACDDEPNCCQRHAQRT